MPAVFVGPYLEVLPDYNNVDVSAVLTQYVQTGLAYAQVLLWLMWCCACPAALNRQDTGTAFQGEGSK